MEDIDLKIYLSKSPQNEEEKHKPTAFEIAENVFHKLKIKVHGNGVDQNDFLIRIDFVE